MKLCFLVFPSLFCCDNGTDSTSILQSKHMRSYPQLYFLLQQDRKRLLNSRDTGRVGTASTWESWEWPLSLETRVQHSIKVNNSIPRGHHILQELPFPPSEAVIHHVLTHLSKCLNDINWHLTMAGLLHRKTPSQKKVILINWFVAVFVCVCVVLLLLLLLLLLQTGFLCVHLAVPEFAL